MRHSLHGFAACVLAGSTIPALAQGSDPNTAMTEPDKVAWQLFIQVNTAAGGKATFETWGSDTDLFQPNPQWPSTPKPMVLRRPIVPTVGREVLQRSGHLLLPPGIASGATEETRRNQSAFDFIVKNNLYKVTGLQAAFGKAISFPVNSIEVKANWVPVAGVPAFTLNRVTAAQVSQQFHVSTGSDGNQYALVSMHVISKLVPNWTWATFEHQLNPGRCDILSCRNSFGAQTAVVPPNPEANAGYLACLKTQALTAMINAANWDPAFANYCLKGSQIDFIDSTGLAVRLGNSITESGFVQQASCMTCHGRAAFNTAGQATSGAGFNSNGAAPLGPIQPSWYWSYTASPPIFEGMPGLQQIATSADFVWSIPFCAIDDTQNPPAASNCASK